MRVALATGTLRFRKRSHEAVAEIPVSVIDALTIRRTLFGTRLTVHSNDGRKVSIGGLDQGRANRLHDAILAEAARMVAPLDAQLKRIDRRQRRLFAGKRYLRHAEAAEFHSAIVEIAQKFRGLCRLARVQASSSTGESLTRLAPLASAAGFESARARANEHFVRNSIPAVRAAASKALSVPLTDEQAGAVATDEDVTLVLAGAGTGKTAVIIGKVAHLILNQSVSPREILVVAFNKQAAAGIRERLPRELKGATVKTFHAFGRRVIADCGVAPDISILAEDEYKFGNAIDDILNELLEDPQQSDEVLKFILYNRAPWRSTFDFSTEAEYDAYVQSVELRTLSEDKVKSLEELTIANYLTEQGVQFRYEAPYPLQTATQHHRQYRPDFYLPVHDIYIEHFALDAQGRPPPGWQGYAEGAQWKRDVHTQNGTTLIETCSWQHEQDCLLSDLHDRLEELGVRFEPVPRATLIEKLGEQKLSWLAELLATFLNHVRNSNLPSDTLRKRARARGDHRRNLRFLKVFKRVQLRYEQMLAEQKALDFHDLIGRAEKHIRDGDWKSPYRYVLVDEFQDISVGRMRLLQALKLRHVAYFLVGDDWQSIYRFAGSDVNLVQGCGKYLGHVNQRALSQTFRFADGILDPSTAFVRRNPEQTQRPLRSASSAVDKGISVIFNDDPGEGCRFALQEIETAAAGEPGSVLVLGRYRKSLIELTTQRQDLELSTVHQAKGREADYVIVVDLVDARFGFPARIEDDPLLELVLPPVSGRAFPFAEERRLFYVALTRARIGAWLITDPALPSTFVQELIRKNEGLRQVGEARILDCPRCTRGRLVRSKSRHHLRCSDYQNCKFLAPRCPNCQSGYAVIAKQPASGAVCTNPDCHDPLPICPRCGIGILVERNSQQGPFLGCSTWVWSEPRCTYGRDIEKCPS